MLMAVRTTLTARLSALFIAAGMAMAAMPAAAQKSSDWAGNFVAEHQGQTGQLSLLVLGSWMGGSYTAGGENFTVVGKIKDSTATGTVTDQYYQQAPFEARLHAAGLIVTLKVKDQNGVEQPVTLNFERPEVAARRQAAAGPGLLGGGANGTGSLQAQPAAGGGGDSRIVGAWRATEAGRSGDFTWASDNFFQFAADGSCSDGGGQTYAGGATSSVGTGRSAASACQWRTQDRVLYLRYAGGQWQEVARYAVHEDGSLMMWTYGNGSKRIWERQ
jgi:hypothetical protein